MFYNCLFILLRVSLKITPYFAKHRVTKMVFQERNCIPFTQKIITAGISRQDDYEVGNAFRCLRIAIIYPTLAILVLKSVFTCWTIRSESIVHEHFGTTIRSEALT